MAIKTLTYLPAPIKSDQALLTEKPNPLTWAISSLALGMLFYDSPKVFLATSAGIVIYQIFRFNQIVHTAEAARRQEIRAWAIHACHVMLSIGVVFFAASLTSFWFLLASRNLQLIYTISHVVQGILTGFIAYTLGMFYQSAVHLTRRTRWVAMEDYIKNYPQPLKETILSSSVLKLHFFISAFLPSKAFDLAPSGYEALPAQFSSKKRLFQHLERYFSQVAAIPEKDPIFKWRIAIHHFQKLNLEDQLKLGPHLLRIAKASTQEQRNQLQETIIHSLLMEYKRIPMGESNVTARSMLIEEFNHLNRTWQALFGEDLHQLMNIDLKGPIPPVPDFVKLVILKAQLQRVADNQGSDTCIDWVGRVDKALTQEQQSEIRIFWDALKKYKGLSDETPDEKINTMPPEE